MSERREVLGEELENIVGGVLKWKDGVVYPKNDPGATYRYTDYSACQAWIVSHWNGTQDESCLQALEAEGLVHKI